ncbi:SdpI family protein [Corynebacterium sp. ES2794-CONJ1]|uniref:SdpI family protein n=1 Tax=unclassified Corynebacterium TaxID=2624378 RepID=UPI0021684440|nr:MULTISPECIES: SdpI family protein [unclassified Corynebacterium]MCS4490474.1 SdpI family protein [Corynebacterium sp. ES2775-CONJ]MCS4492254.1 SdpI family protein [Corynebacterium sp. ES2715-CONJ3]MCS4532262.1 SdpI family protein [Corynebacterium sp. ES2730-CONJ]MCU9519773.1 SdpI family protein [Corynebacterium sp. ES2794-CONJ1]
MFFLGLLASACALIVIMSGVLAWTKNLPGNRFIGIKVPEVRASKDIWDHAHSLAGPLWVAAGVLIAIGSAPIYGGLSWLLTITAVSFIGALYMIGLGNSLAARAAGILRSNKESSSGCSGDCCGGGASTAIDLEAVRQAAKRSDQ